MSFGVEMACPIGFEPTTCRLEGGCSIQLSYGHASEGDIVSAIGKQALNGLFVFPIDSV